MQFYWGFIEVVYFNNDWGTVIYEPFEGRYQAYIPSARGTVYMGSYIVAVIKVLSITSAKCGSPRRRIPVPVRENSSCARMTQ